jgi:hypothetical protein
MDSTMFAFHGSVSRLHDGTYAPAIVITDVTTGKRRRIRLATHFAEKRKAQNQARERSDRARLLPAVHASIRLLVARLGHDSTKPEVSKGRPT